MEIQGQMSIHQILFFVLYGITAVVPFLAALYLLLRRSNAIAPSIRPPVRLRRWAAAFFLFSTLSHVWWLPFYIYASDQHSVCYVLLVILDSVLLLTTIAGTMLSMLQDRRRPVWPVLVGLIPFVALGVAIIVYPDEMLEQIAVLYILLFCTLFIGYMVFAIRRYGRWLNDNYADLENKKVWLSQVVAFLCMLLLALYFLSTNMVLICWLHIIDIVLVCILLWRVETLQRLPSQAQQPATQPTSIDLDQIEQLLVEHCVNTQLYLQHDLTLAQLALSVGTNRSYLSQYFSRQGYTYNTYINSQRVNHFIRCYEAAVAAGQPIVAQQLAQESGFRSYSTFGRAFAQRTGQTVTEWMSEREG